MGMLKRYGSGQCSLVPFGSLGYGWLQPCSLHCDPMSVCVRVDRAREQVAKRSRGGREHPGVTILTPPLLAIHYSSFL